MSLTLKSGALKGKELGTSLGLPNAMKRSKIIYVCAHMHENMCEHMHENVHIFKTLKAENQNSKLILKVFL